MVAASSPRASVFRAPAWPAACGLRVGGMLRGVAFAAVLFPTLLAAQYSETKMGEYLHGATAAANGGVYAGYDSIGSIGPALYKPIRQNPAISAPALIPRKALLQTASLTT
jgi:hypothetical protein